MKLKPKSPPLPENVFTLNEDSLPTSADTDPWGKLWSLEEMLVGLPFNKLILYSF